MVSKVMLHGPDADAPNERVVTCDSLPTVLTRRRTILCEMDRMTQMSSRPTMVMFPATPAPLSWPGSYAKV
jgi:hypothetical protein